MKISRQIVIVLFLFSNSLLSSCGPGQLFGPTITPTPTGTLRYDGPYHSVEQNWNQFLRFYSDGTVLSAAVSVSSIENPKIVFASLDKVSALPITPKGKYTINGSKLEFTTISAGGAVDYTGTINGGELTLNIYSHITGFKATFVYHFIEISEIKP
jgi:hypothetical protein